MRRTITIAAIILVAAGVLIHLQWRVRAAGAARTIAPVSLATLEFKANFGDGRWVPIAAEDGPGMVASFNWNRQEFARMTTPVFAAHDNPNNPKIALAPMALLRYDGQVEEWYCRKPDDPLLEKYRALSLRAEVASNEPTVTARQIDQPRGGDIEIVVTDRQKTQKATVVVFVRRGYYDEKLKVGRYDEGTPVTLKAEGQPGRYRGVYAVSEVVHQGTLIVEYVYNDLPQSHNDYTRLVSCPVTMLYH